MRSTIQNILKEVQDYHSSVFLIMSEDERFVKYNLHVAGENYFSGGPNEDGWESVDKLNDKTFQEFYINKKENAEGVISIMPQTQLDKYKPKVVEYVMGFFRKDSMSNVFDQLTEQEDDFEWVGELSNEPFHHILIQNDERDFGLRFTKVDRILFNPPVQIGSREFNDVAFWLEDREFYPENLDFNRNTSYIEIIKFGNLFGNPPRESWDKGHFYDKEDFGRYRVGPVLSDQELYKLSQKNTRPGWNGNIWYEQFMREFRRAKG